MKKILLIASILFALSLPMLASAQTSSCPPGTPGLKCASGILNQVADPSKTGLNADLGGSIATVIKTVLALVGTIFLVLTIYAGIMWMTAQGDETKVEKAIEIIKAAVLGLVIIMSAYAITFFVTSKLAGVAGGTTQPAPASQVACSSHSDQSACESDSACLWFVNPPPSTLPGTCIGK